MAGDKKFKIAFDVNFKALKDAQKVMQDLIGLAPKLGQALSKVSFLGGTVGGQAGANIVQGGNAKGLQAQVQGMKHLGETGQKLAKIYQNDVNRTIAATNREFTASTERLRKLTEAFEKFEAATGGKGGNKARRRMRDQLDREVIRNSGLQQASEGDMPIPGSFMARMMNGGAAQGARQLAAMAGLGPLAYAVGPVALGIGAYKVGESALSNMVQGGRLPFAVRAESAAAANAPLMAALSRDTDLAYGQSLINQSPDKKYSQHVAGQSAAEMIDYTSGLAHVKNAVLGTASLMMGVNDPYKATRERWNATDEMRRTAYNETALDVAGLAAKSDPVGAAKLKHVMGNAQGIAGFSYRFGTTAYDDSYGHGIFGSQMRQGMETAAMAGLGVSGANSGDFKRTFVEAVKAGMNEGIAASVIGRTAAGGGNIISALGGLEASHKDLIAQNVSQMYGPQSMLTNADGLAEVLRRGVGEGAMGMRNAQQNVGGLQAFANIPGRSAYNQSFAYMDAKRLMPNADPYQLDLMVNAMNDPAVAAHMMSGRGLPESLQAALGVSGQQGKDLARKLVAQRPRALIAQWHDTKKESRAHTLMRELRDSGGDLEKFYKDHGEKGIEQVSALLWDANGRQGSIGDMQGLLRVGGGGRVDSKSGQGGDLPAGFTQLHDAAMKLERQFESLTNGAANFAQTMINVSAQLISTIPNMPVNLNNQSVGSPSPVRLGTSRFGSGGGRAGQVQTVPSHR